MTTQTSQTVKSNWRRVYGFLSVIPPIVAVALAIITKRVLLSLFVSIWVGGLIAAGGNPFEAVGITFTWLKDVMVDPWNARFLVMTALLGCGAAFMFKTGGSQGLINVLEKKLTTKKRVQFLSYFLGLIIFFNDYVNSVIVGNASKDISAKHKISREKLSYVLDSTAAPIATIGPVSDWIGFQVSLLPVPLQVLALLEWSLISHFCSRFRGIFMLFFVCWQFR